MKYEFIWNKHSQSHQYVLCFEVLAIYLDKVSIYGPLKRLGGPLGDRGPQSENHWAKQKQNDVSDTSATERVGSITSVVSVVSIKDRHLPCSSLKRIVAFVLQMWRRRHLVLQMTDPRVVKARHLRMVEGPRPARETRMSTKVKIVRTECAGLWRSSSAVCHRHRPHAGRSTARPK